MSEGAMGGGCQLNVVKREAEGTVALFTQRRCRGGLSILHHWLFTQSCGSYKGVMVHVMIVTSVCFQGVSPGVLLLI